MPPDCQVVMAPGASHQFQRGANCMPDSYIGHKLIGGLPATEEKRRPIIQLHRLSMLWSQMDSLDNNNQSCLHISPYKPCSIDDSMPIAVLRLAPPVHQKCATAEELAVKNGAVRIAEPLALLFVSFHSIALL